MASAWEEETAVRGEAQATAETAQSRPCLILVSGPNLGEVFPLLGDELTIGRAPPADVQIIDEGMSRRHARVSRQGDAMVLEDLGSRNGTFCNGVKITRHELREGDKVQLGARTVFRFVRQELVDEDYQRELFQSALRDVQTKVFNRRYFLDRLESEFAYAARHKVPLSIVILDLDLFSTLNAEHGQAVGDYVLGAWAEHVGEWIRAEDVLARVGPDELGLICRGIDATGARIFAERLRRKTCETPYERGGVLLPVTASAGASSLQSLPVASPALLLEAAQNALERAKAEGCNRVIVAGDP